MSVNCTLDTSLSLAVKSHVPTLLDGENVGLFFSDFASFSSFGGDDL
jgi:hypothetical protein